MINATATRTTDDRKVTYQWEGPAIPDKNDPGWNECIQLIISHDKDRRCYNATLYKVAIGKRETYSMIRYELFSSPSALVLKKPVARYSGNSFSLFESEVLDKCDELISYAPDVPGGLAGTLLRDALGYAGAASSI